MSIDEKAKKLRELAEEYKDSPDKIREYKANPVETLKKAGLELTQEDYDQIMGKPAVLGDGKCTVG